MSTSTSEQQAMGDALIQPGETKQMAIERLEGELSELSDTASRLDDVALIAAGKADFAARKSRETASRGMRGDLDTSRLLQDAANVSGVAGMRLVCADILSSCAGQSPVLYVEGSILGFRRHLDRAIPYVMLTLFLLAVITARTNHELKIKQQQLDSLQYPNGKPIPEPEYPVPWHPILGAFGWLAKTSYDTAAYYLTPTAKTDTSSTSTAQRV